jgi:hypothetical protein
MRRDNRNGRSFERKLEYLVSAIAGLVGLPTVGKKTRKYPILEVCKAVVNISQLLTFLHVGLRCFQAAECSDLRCRKSDALIVREFGLLK